MKDKKEKGKEIIKLLPEINEIFTWVSIAFMGKSREHYCLHEEKKYANMLEEHYSLNEKDIDDIQKVLVFLLR